MIKLVKLKKLIKKINKGISKIKMPKNICVYRNQCTNCMRFKIFCYKINLRR